MLEINELETGYGKKQVLFGTSLRVKAGEVIALIGPNGAGKSTVLKSVCGLIPIWKGDILFDGLPLNGITPTQRVSQGITFAPQGGQVFQDLTVIENLEVGGLHLTGKHVKKRVAELLDTFIALKDRAGQCAGTLSGGEQQMLALARSLVPKPKLLMLDEPSLGLSPSLAKSSLQTIAELRQQTGVSILIVEQKVREVLEIADRVYGMKLGRVVFDGESKVALDNPNILKEIFL